MLEHLFPSFYTELSIRFPSRASGLIDHADDFGNYRTLPILLL
jgi:hypothetical protein